MKQTILLTGLCAGMLLGCANVQVPDYKRPEAPTKASWSQPAGPAVSAAETISPRWWTEFRDPALDALVARAIAGNFDLKILAGRIDVAGAQIDEVRAGALPSADFGIGSNLQKTTGQKFSKQTNLGTQVNWELDIWGKVAKGVQAQTAEYRATEAEWRAGYLQLVAGVSTTYFQILQLDEQTEQQQRALARNQQILRIYETMRSNGLVADTEVLRQRAENNRLTKELLELRRLRATSENALATLLGVPAGEFKIQPGRLQDRVRVPRVPAGLPLDLLARRPDVVAAEFRVLQAHDLVGQARLAQLPSVSLTGQGGTAAFRLGDLFRSFTLGLLPSINIPAFNPGIKARVKTSDAQLEVAEQDYRRSVIAAFEEVETALVNLEARRQQNEELRLQVDQLAQVSAQTKAQLEVGVVSQLEVFESERSLLSAQLALLAGHQQVLSDTVTLYKALGGGWAPVQIANARDEAMPPSSLRSSPPEQALSAFGTAGRR
jgi:NodT family efflux transporter outer membrane factor (OMF) lipoprotein